LKEVTTKAYSNVRWRETHDQTQGPLLGRESSHDPDPSTSP
jgi:hypothetical protein